jgi:hypothetical protein
MGRAAEGGFEWGDEGHGEVMQGDFFDLHDFR